MRKMVKKAIGVAMATALVALAFSAPALAADRLQVQDSNSNVVFKVDDTGAIQTGKAIITSQGWSGVGTTNPLAAIHAKGVSSPASQIMMTRTDSAGFGAGFIAYHNNITAAQCTGAGVPTTCCTGAGTGPTCPASVLPGANTRLGYFFFGGYATDMVSPKNAAGMASKTEGAWTDTSTPANFTFETTGAATGRTEKFRISAEGNVVAGNLGGSATGDMLTTVTNGFLYIPNVAGTLTTCSSVQSYPGHVPVWFDNSAAKICTCQGTTLKCTAALN